MAEEQGGGVSRLLSRFGGGRVAQMALQRALASARRASGSGGGGASPLAEDLDSDAASVAPSGGSVTHHSPVAVPLEVEYSQASQQSWVSYEEEAGGQQTPPRCQASCLAEAAAAPSSSSVEGSPAAAPAQPGDDEDALLLSALLNSGRPGSGHPSPLRGPQGLRLRHKLQQEPSGAAPFSPLAAVVSEHSFEEGSGPAAPGLNSGSCLRGHGAVAESLQGLASAAAGSGEVQEEQGSASPVAALLSYPQAGATAVDPSQAAAEEEPPPLTLHHSRRPGMSRKGPLLHRAGTPLTAALAREQPSSSDGGAPEAKGALGQQEPKPRQQGGGSSRFAQPVAEASHCTVKQQLWSFEDIPQGRATIPSSHLPPEKLPAEPRPKSSQPRTAPHPGPAAVARKRQQQGAGLKAATARLGSASQPQRHSGPTPAESGLKEGGLRPCSALRPGPARPGSGAQPTVQAGQHSIHAEDALQSLHGAAKQPRPQAAEAGAAWPLQVQGLTPEQADVAYGTYCHDRFQKHMDRLSELMAKRLAKRQQEQEILIQGVSGFEERVRAQGLGTQPPAEPVSEAAQQESQQRQQLEPEGWGFEARTLAKARAAAAGLGGQRQPAAVAGQGASLPCIDSGASSSSSTLPASGHHLEVEAAIVQEEEPLVLSRSNSTPRLRAALAQRQQGRSHPEPTAANGVPTSTPQAQAAEQGAIVGRQDGHEQLSALNGALEAALMRDSPSAQPGSTEGALERLKPIMQVKGEQDLALKYLSSQRRPFRANPLPLSTAEPRYAELAQRAQERRADAHAQRKELLRSQERPFSFYERDKERQHAALVAASSGSSTGAQSETPQAFHAHPVPVSTTEARYALLVAEMQLQNRTMKGRSLVSPTRTRLRPSTAGAVQRAREPPPPRPASSQACGVLPGGCGTGPNASPAVSPLDTCTALLSAPASMADIARHPGLHLSDADSSDASHTASMFSSFKGAAAFGSGPASGSGAASQLSNPIWEGSGEAAEALPQEGAAKTLPSGDAQSPATAAAAPSAMAIEDEQVRCAEEGSGGGGPTCALATRRSLSAAGSGGGEYSCEFEVEEAGSEVPAVVQQGPEQAATAPALPPPEEPSNQPLVQPRPTTSSGRGGGSSSPAGSPRVGTTRSQQLKLRAVREGLASGRFASEVERASLSEQDLREMQLLCSSPKRRPRSAVAVRPGGVGNSLGASGATALRRRPAAAAPESAVAATTPLAAEVRPPAVKQACAAAQEHAAPEAASDEPLGPASVEPASVEMGLVPLEQEDSLPGVAVPVACLGPKAVGACHKLDMLDSPTKPAWRLGTVATLLPSPLPADSAGGDSMGSGGGSSSEGQQVDDAQEAAVGAPALGVAAMRASLVGMASGERRDTPLPHILARHRQAEEAAKAEVREVLSKRGLAVLNYVEGGS